MRIAIQMDPIDTINVNGDTTYILALEAQKRGYEVYYYTPDKLSLEHDTLYVESQNLILHHNKTPFYTLGSPTRCNVQEFDVLLIRQDPPYNMDYLTYTYLLERIHPKPFVINHPASLRNFPEKIFALQFPELTPPTLITKDRNAIERFAANEETFILKPLYAFGGRDVYHTNLQDENFNAILDALLDKYNEPIIAQKFLPEVTNGDKRIILIDGEPVGAINRVPPKDSIRSNLVLGGSAEKTDLTKRDLEICNTIAPALKENNLMLVGIDVIGNYLTEINVTSPTGIQAINKKNDVQLEVVFWDKVNQKLAN
jgi:glutathione synthase